MIESIRVLFVTANPNLAEQVISSIRSRGCAVRPEQVDDGEGLTAALRETRFDVVVFTEPGLNLARSDVDAALQASGRRTPLVLMTERPEEERLPDYEAGVFAVVDHQLVELTAILTLRAADSLHLRQQIKRMENSLQESERRSQLLLDNSRDAIAYIHDGMHVYANASWRERFGVDDPDDIEGLPLMDLVAPDSRDDLKRFLRSYQEGSEEAMAQRFQLRTMDGEAFEAELHLSSTTVEGEAATQVQLSSGEDKELAQKIDYLSQRDLVTGLYNRQYFQDAIETTRTRAAETEKPFALLTVAVDHFPEIRANAGMSGADLMLADVGQIIESHFPETAVVARLEAERFGVLLPEAQQAAAEERLDALQEAINSRVFEVGTLSTHGSVSAGGVIADETAPDTEELLAQTDRALEDAVKAGGGTHRFYRPAEGELTQAQLDQQWKNRILEALEENRLELRYQPVVNLHGADRPRYSVFVRLLDPDGTVHEPVEFLPSAERTEVATRIDRWILRHALAVLARQLKKDSRTQFFLKLTNGSLGDPSVLTWLNDDLHALRIPADNVVVELKEPTIVTHLKPAMNVGRGLKEMHGHLCVDDFGNGLKPFQLLQHLDADHIKLDASFVKNLAESEENQETIREYTEAAHAKGKQVIVPHIEDASALAVLYGLNVNLVQGFFLQAPMPEPDFDFESV
ncbi:GGDEF domain-containing phosphodiesterase [Thioalkalivibrio sp. ALgr3]|uniref:EAL domain-containing response regulator n=1 Tax=Thioalkalivibrio sp. ALgr3 TaxID=1239292 RepID=UPI00035DFE83|nr:GGDEF domain-containing phosphodiesterase [Thioalkalivibrio sp. ALgr3]